MSIEVTCRRCGRKAPSDEFKVDHVYKLAVCKVCYTEREKNIPKKTKEEPTLSDLMSEKKEEQKEDEKDDKHFIKKSKLFDEEDEYLERAVERKREKLKEEKENRVKVKKISEEKVLYPCKKCKYQFKYNIYTKRPIDCPYCATKVEHNIEF